MTRTLLGILALLAFISPVEATLSPRNHPAHLTSRPLPVPVQAVLASSRAAPESAADGELLVTEETEIYLDGRRCRYAEVPDTAVIKQVELDADAKKALIIRFRSK
jgi:hypothetical protein